MSFTATKLAEVIEKIVDKNEEVQTSVAEKVADALRNLLDRHVDLEDFVDKAIERQREFLESTGKGVKDFTRNLAEEVDDFLGLEPAEAEAN